MTDGLLMVLSDPGAMAPAEFHDWYDHEHLPARTALPGVRSGERYRADDGAVPGWLAVYELDLAVLDRPDYRALRDERSPRERAVVERLAVLDRRVLARVTETAPATAPATGPPAPHLVTVGLAVADEDDAREVARWYDEEHLPALAAVPGWRRSARHRLVEGAGPGLVAVHEVDDPATFATDAYRAATSTPWRARVMARVVARERRTWRRREPPEA